MGAFSLIVVINLLNRLNLYPYQILNFAMIVLESPSKLMAAQLANCTLEDSSSECNPTENTLLSSTAETSSQILAPEKSVEVSGKSPTKRERPNTRSKANKEASVAVKEGREKRQIFSRCAVAQKPSETSKVKISPMKKHRNDVSRQIQFDSSDASGAVAKLEATKCSKTTISECSVEKLTVSDSITGKLKNSDPSDIVPVKINQSSAD